MKNFLKSNVVLIITSCLSWGQEFPFDNPKDDSDVSQRLAEGGVALIPKYGDRLLDWIKYIPPRPLDPSEMRVPGFRKTDYPIVVLLTNGGQATVAVLEKTNFFKIPTHPADLEMISYLLVSILDEEKAIEFANKLFSQGDEVEKSNWKQIGEMLKNPQNKNGLFFTRPENDEKKLEEYRESYSKYLENRRNFRKVDSTNNLNKGDVKQMAPERAVQSEKDEEQQPSAQASASTTTKSDLSSITRWWPWLAVLVALGLIGLRGFLKRP